MSRLPSLGPRGEGWVALQVLFLGLIAFAGVTQPVAGGSLDSPVVRTAGYLVLFAGLGLAGWAIVGLSAAHALSALPLPLEQGRIATTGPYRLIRHPIYTGLILASIGGGLVGRSPLALAGAVALAVVLDLKRRREETWLLERYPRYAAYRARTKALIPFVY